MKIKVDECALSNGTPSSSTYEIKMAFYVRKVVWLNSFISLKREAGGGIIPFQWFGLGQCVLGFLLFLSSVNPLSDSFSVIHQFDNGMSKSAENISVFLIIKQFICVTHIEFFSLSSFSICAMTLKE